MQDNHTGSATLIGLQLHYTFLAFERLSKSLRYHFDADADPDHTL